MISILDKINEAYEFLKKYENKLIEPSDLKWKENYFHKVLDLKDIYFSVKRNEFCVEGTCFPLDENCKLLKDHCGYEAQAFVFGGSQDWKLFNGGN
jgi:hypothetical protein